MPRSSQAIIERLSQRFRQRYNRQPEAAGGSPGRIEVLGNHTDYNGGRVLTATIDRYVVAVGARRSDRAVRVFSEAFQEDAILDAAADSHAPRGHWSDYVAAAIVGLNRAARSELSHERPADIHLPGMDVVVGGDLPIGAGLSSSAALEAAIAKLLLRAAGCDEDASLLAEALQTGEAQCAGVLCGLLDQYTVLCGDDQSLLVFDSQTREASKLNIRDLSLAFLLINSQVRRELGGNAPYNTRRTECETAAERIAFASSRPLMPLCRIGLADFRAGRSWLPHPLGMRARHVIMEHQRVNRAAECLISGNLERFGRLLNTSHRSSARLFQNSHPTLDRLQQVAAAVPGCLGCRLTGAGWGGCVLAVTRSDEAAIVAGELTEAFAGNADLRDAEVIRCETAPAASSLAIQ